MIRIALAATLLAWPASAQQTFDCPPDVASDSPRCVPTAGLASQDYNIGDRLGEDVPIEMADREDMPPLMPGEGFALIEGHVLRVMADSRIIMDVLDVR
jgi:hypothetical protein